MICVIDYGAGNLLSVCNAVNYCLGGEEKCIVSNDSSVIRTADKVILPGVGSFGKSMDKLKKNGLVNSVYGCLQANKPFMGICLGLQLLFEGSDESPDSEGLGFFKGRIRRFPGDMGLKIPHVGWNSLDYIRKGSLCDSISQASTSPYVYFVHSYYLDTPEDIVMTKTVYGVEFISSIQCGNIIACQFHPEKSGEYGINLLKRFLKT